MYPSNPKGLAEVFSEATAKPYGYLIVNLRPNTKETCRLYSNVFGETENIVVFAPAKT